MCAGWRTFDASRGDSTLEHPYVKRPGLHAVASYILQEPRDGTARYTEGTISEEPYVHMYVCMYVGMYAGWRTFDASRGDSTLEHPYVKRPRLHAVASYLLQEPKDGTARHTEGTTMYVCTLQPSTEACHNILVTSQSAVKTKGGSRLGKKICSTVEV